MQQPEPHPVRSTSAGADLRLSVVIPCYNVEPYLMDAVRGLQRNADDGFEFIFVDDASTDRTPRILEQVLPTMPGARVVTLPSNTGLAGARNAGLDLARGEYIAFLDGDDLVAPGYYRRLVQEIDDLQVDFLRTDHVRFTGNRRVVDRVQFGPRRTAARPRTGILPTDRNTSVDYPYAWAGIFHRRLLDAGLLHFTPGLRTCEDRPWIWRLHLHAESMAAVNLLGMFYRRNIRGSLSQVSDTRQFDFIPAFDQIVADASADAEREAFLPKALRTYSAMICHHLSRLDTYDVPLASTLRGLCRQAVKRLPQAELGAVVHDLDAQRRRQMTELIKAA